MKKQRGIFFAVLLTAIIGCSAVSMAATSYSGTHWYNNNTVYGTGFVSITKNGGTLGRDKVLYSFGLYPSSPQHQYECDMASMPYKVFVTNLYANPVKTGTLNGQSYYSNNKQGFFLKQARYEVTTDRGTFSSYTVSY